MKMTKKLLSVVLAIAMSASLMVPVFASPLSESEGGEKTGYVVNDMSTLRRWKRQPLRNCSLSITRKKKQAEKYRLLKKHLMNVRA